MSDVSEFDYVGFWPRVWATIIDTALMLIVVVPLLLVFMRASDQEAIVLEGPAAWIVTYVIPALIVIWFWSRKQATPGKMAIGARIVDADTGLAPSTRQEIVRYFGYFLSSLFFGLGFIWVAFDRRKQGWHDKLANTIVVRVPPRI